MFHFLLLHIPNISKYLEVFTWISDIYFTLKFVDSVLFRDHHYNFTFVHSHSEFSVCFITSWFVWKSCFLFFVTAISFAKLNMLLISFAKLITLAFLTSTCSVFNISAYVVAIQINVVANPYRIQFLILISRTNISLNIGRLLIVDIILLLPFILFPYPCNHYSNLSKVWTYLRNQFYLTFFDTSKTYKESYSQNSLIILHSYRCQNLNWSLDQL